MLRHKRKTAFSYSNHQENFMTNGISVDDDLTNLKYVHVQDRATVVRSEINSEPSAAQVDEFFSTWYQVYLFGFPVYVRSELHAALWNNAYSPSGFPRPDSSDYEDGYED
jgi:hypothetical protein